MIAFSQLEVIPIVEGLSEKTRDRLWPALKDGTIIINSTEIIIPDQNSLFLQSRSTPYDYTKIDLRRDKTDYFKVYQIAANKEWFAYLVLSSEGRFYLFKRKRKTKEIQGSVLRQSTSLDRIFLLENNNLVATGLYRPALVGFLNRYMKGSIEEQWKNAKEKYDPLYQNHKAYTISVYDNQFTEIDSGNVIHRTGDNARAYEGLFLTLAVDITQDDILYLIDNDQGYVVEKYTDFTTLDSTFEIKNKNFKKRPTVMTLENEAELKSKDRAYSVPYALYEKAGYLITCFLHAPKHYDPVKPPYYYDVSTVRGELLHSGVLEYPIITEDDGDKVFFYVKQAGGWFEDDLHFLVGVTTDELINGKAIKMNIDKSIEIFKNSQ